jgi:hypothetical protein
MSMYAELTNTVLGDSHTAPPQAAMPSLNLFSISAPVPVCVVPIIPDAISRLLSSEFYRRILCCLVGDFSSTYLEDLQMSRTKAVAYLVIYI